MSQNVFTNPYVVSPPTLSGVGNGTLTIDRLTHFTITQHYTAICTAVAPFTVFTILGSLDGPVGVATVGTQFIDQDLKIFLTINQGPIQFAIGDQFDLDVHQGTDLNQQNIDTYDELPQKNFSQGILGQNKGDDNFRFTTAAKTAKCIIQDLEFTSLLTDELGNGILLEYYETSTPQKASLTIQDLKYEADSAGSAGNGISVEYEDYTPAVNATLQVQDLLWAAIAAGVSGNNIQIAYTTGGVAGSEVVTVIPGPTTVIQIQIQSGVSTAHQIKTAVQMHGTAGLLITGFKTGTGLETQTAPFGPTNLAGGVDAVGAAGFEVVTVVGQAIKVKLQAGVSTATQVKTAVDAFPAAAALVNVTIVGTGSSPQAAPEPQTNLSGGTDSIGAPGAEVVTVEGTRIKVGFQTGINTAQNIKDAILGVPAAAALVSILITGSASNPQSAPTTRYLSHGQRSDSWYLNINEITNPTQFYDGNGNLCLNYLVTHAGIFTRGQAYLRGVLTLDDILSSNNDSGPAIPNVQAAINKIFKDKNIFVGTEDNSKVRWNAPNLYFTSPLVIRFEDTNIFNRILTSNSPLNIPDGHSVYVTINRNVSVNLTPVIAASIPVGEDLFRICTRIGADVIFFDNTIIGENQVARIGAAIDLSPQIFTLFDAAGQFIYDPSIAGKISWNSQLKLKPLGSSAVVTIYADEITLADDEVAYVLLDDPIVTTTKVVQKASRATVLMNRPDTFWLFYRSGTKVYLRFGGEMEPGEERNIGDTISDDIYTVLDMSGETDASLSYTTILGGPAVPNRYIQNGEGLQKSAKRLDTRVGQVSDIVRQDRLLKMVEGGVWAFEISGTNKLEWSADSYIQVAGVALSRNTIQAGSVVLPSAGDVAYVTINRTAGAPTNLAVTVGNIATLTVTDDMVIFARRTTTGVIVGTHSFLLMSGERLDLDGCLADLNRWFSSMKFKKHPTNPNRVIITDADVPLLDGSVLGQLFQQKRLSFTGAVIDFTTGVVYKPDESTILGTNFTPMGIGLNEYLWYGVSLMFAADLVNNTTVVTLKVEPGNVSGPSITSAHHPAVTGDKPIGWVWVQDAGGTGIQPITEANFVRLASGAGGSGGTGGSGIEVFDEGVSISTGITQLDFVGVGVTASLVSPGRVSISVTGTGGGGGGINELTSNCDGDVVMKLAYCDETWVLQDSNLVRWKVTISTSGELITSTPTTDPVTPGFRISRPSGGYYTVGVTIAGDLYTDDVNLVGNVDDKFYLKDTNNALWRLTANDLGQIVMVTAETDEQLRITDVQGNNYEVTKLTSYGVLKYFRLFNTIAQLPAPPTTFTGTVATAWLNTVNGPRHIFYNTAVSAWQYVHDNSPVV